MFIQAKEGICGLYLICDTTCNVGKTYPLHRGDCPLGFRTTHGIHLCYWVSDYSVKWDATRQECNRHASSLVSIMSWTEDTFLWYLLERYSHLFCLFNLCNA